MSDPPAARLAVLRRWLGPVAALLVGAVALVALHHELGALRYQDVARAVVRLPRGALLAALGLTVAAYAVLTGYDALALTYVGRRVPRRRLVFGSFVSYAISQTLGFPLLTGGSVRYRLWTAWGLTAGEAAAALGFAGATFLLGLVAVTALACLLAPADGALLLHLPVPVLRALGVVGLALVAAYVAWSVRGGGRPLRVAGRSIPVPRPGLAALQLLLAAADWTVAGSVLWVLLPAGHGVAFLPFLGIFLLAHVAGLVSHVPGGLGVFDSVVVLLLAPQLPAAPVLAALVAYRLVFYLLPFALGVLLLAVHEARRPPVRAAAQRTGRAAGRLALRAGAWGGAVLPHALGLAAFVAGAVLLASGATPAVHGRVVRLHGLVPIGVIELSHFVGSVAGAVLVVLAWGLTRRLDAAWALSVVVLGVGIVASLLKGLDWEEALLLAVALAALAPSRRLFYRRAALTSEPLTPGWIVAVVAALGVTVWLGLFSYKHVEYSHELWWRFTVRGDAPRFLRATVGALAAVLVLALLRLLRHARARPAPPTAEELARVREVAAHSSDVAANLALLGDKALLFSESGSGVLMYGVAGRSWVALGDPIGTPEERTELAWRFRETADRHGGWPVFYEVGTESLPLYIDLGLTLRKLGEEAIVPLSSFTLDGGARKGLRRTLKEMARAGVTFELAEASAVPALLPALRAVSDAWLAEKRTREKGFSLGRFDEAYLRNFPVALARQDGAVVAFANVWGSAGREMLSVDLMRYSPAAPPGVMEFLFIELMRWGREAGYGSFNLGMAPLAGLQPRTLAPLWSRVGALLYRHGEHFYNFQGLRQYKEKFGPRWEPRYLASPGGLALPRILTNVAALVGGGLRGVVTK
ncbi:MAG TPA: bifunctional lysylphosphatidylglycerol flippase/synthetase MprF [Gemmatimonadaceae bacterium]|nr:bifunctional lysylphosphatidylglycerol flippase/synthetase MprF [Gemmatimonadaceae bacterium]